MKNTQELRLAATQRDAKGLDVREVPLHRRRQKCFLLTFPLQKLTPQNSGSSSLSFGLC